MLTLNPTLPDLLLGTAVDRSGSFALVCRLFNFDPPSTLHWTLCPWYRPDSKGRNVPTVDIYALQPKSHSLSLKIEYYLNVPGHL